jgi:hypothetical protein
MNFLVYKSEIYEGRGWNSRPEAPYNVNELVIGIIEGSLDVEQNATIETLIEHGIFLEKISENFEINFVDDFSTFPLDLTKNRNKWDAEEPSEELDLLSDGAIDLVVVTDTLALSSVKMNCDNEVKNS